MCEFDSVLFFGGKGKVLRLSVYDGLRVDPSRLSGKEGGDDDARRVSVEEGDAPALVAPSVLERVEADDADLVYADGCQRSNVLGDSEEILDFGVEIADFLVMTQDDSLKVGASLSFEEHLLALLSLTCFMKELSYEEKLCDTENPQKDDTSEQCVGSQQKGYTVHRGRKRLCVPIVSSHCSIFPVAL